MKVKILEFKLGNEVLFHNIWDKAFYCIEILIYYLNVK